MLRLRPEHISAYQMGVEDGSVLGEKALAGLYHEPADEICAAQYALLQKLLSDAGYEQYEVSNFALPGRRGIAQQRLLERLPYIGLGPGSHSFDGDRRRSWNVPDVDIYVRYWLPEALQSVEHRGSAEAGDCASDIHAVSGCETLTDEDVLVEKVMLGAAQDVGSAAFGCS